MVSLYRRQEQRMCTLWPQSSRRGAILCAAAVHTKEGKRNG